MPSNIYSASLSGMNAAQYGISVTQHNIANASTPGYSRQMVVLNSRLPQGSGSGFVGQGVDVTGVKRNYDQFLSTQVRQEQSQASYLSSYLASMKQIDNIVADPAAGVAPALQNFFNSVNSMASAADSVAARQTVLSNGQALVNRFQAIDQRLTDIANSTTGQITGSVQLVNTYATQIATLNNSIKNAIATGQGQQPNDLLDQRDQIINNLNKEIKVSVQPQSDGTMSVFIGNGQALVVADQAMGMQVVQSPTDPTKVDVAYVKGNSIVPIQQNSLQGGNLGAYLAFRDQSLEPARNALGRVALGLASALNQQNQMGQDLNGALGANIFNVANPRVNQGANNTGTAALTATISNVSAVTASDYLLKFDGTNYTVTRSSDNSVVNLGTSMLPAPTIDGVTLNVSVGAMAAGDTFLIRPVADAARNIAVLTSDPTKLAAGAPMRTSAALANTGTGTISAGTVNAPPPLNANIQAPVTITFTSPTTFTVTGAVPAVAGPVAYTPGQNISYNGWTMQISGAPKTGDAFNVSINSGARSDSRNALLMAGLQTQNSLGNGTMSIEGAYSQFVSAIGAKTSELTVTSTAQDSMVASTVAAQQSFSGVNLDEEAANLLQYQRAYQASAKAMQIANSMFDSLLNLGR